MHGEKIKIKIKNKNKKISFKPSFLDYSPKHEKKLHNLQQCLLPCPRKRRATIRPGRIQNRNCALCSREYRKYKEDNETREDRIATNNFPLRTARV